MPREAFYMSEMWKKLIPNNFVRNIAEWVLVFAGAALLATVINTFIMRTANVSGPSMTPTLSHGDVVLVNKLAYRFGTPKYNDIVVFPYAGDPSEYYIKRVIGLPGDEMDWLDGFFYRNGEPLDDAFSGEWVNGGTVLFPLIVPDGSCFVLGDNRWVSEDSRYVEVGCMAFPDLTGKVSLRLLPFSKLGFIQ